MRPSHGCFFATGLFCAYAFDGSSADLAWLAFGAGALAIWCAVWEGNT